MRCVPGCREVHTGGEPQGRRSLGSPRRGWSIMLKLILNKYDAKVRTGLIWLRMLTRDGLLLLQ